MLVGVAVQMLLRGFEDCLMDPTTADQPPVPPRAVSTSRNRFGWPACYGPGSSSPLSFIVYGLILFSPVDTGGPEPGLRRWVNTPRSSGFIPADIFDGLRHGASGDFLPDRHAGADSHADDSGCLTVVLFIQHKEAVFANLAAVVLILLLLGLVGIGA